MAERILSSALLMTICFAPAAPAACDADCAAAYTVPGRQQMFPLSLSGVRLAYQTFETGMADDDCNDCPELVFLHALSRTVLLFADKSDLIVNDSFMEIAEAFGFSITGDTLEFLDIDASAVVDVEGRYVIPAGAPTGEEIKDILDNQIIPEVNDIIAELETISDASGSGGEFRIHLTPAETGLESPLEVDYGDVLMLRALLTAVESILTLEMAYDLEYAIDRAALNRMLYTDGIRMPETLEDYIAVLDVLEIDPRDLITINFNNINFDNPQFDAAIDLWRDVSLNTYLFDRRPWFGRIYPTPNNPEIDGSLILARAAHDLVAALNIFKQAADYIMNENTPPGTDDQEDELLYFDPAGSFYHNWLYSRLDDVRTSLADDTSMLYPFETTLEYQVYDSTSRQWGTLDVVLDYTGACGDEGRLTVLPGTLVPSPWSVEDVEISVAADSVVDIEFEHRDQNGIWDGGACFEATLSANADSFTDGTFSWFGPVGNGTFKGLTGTLTRSLVEDVNVDLNPFYGNSARYPDPVPVKAMLPRLTADNAPMTGTFGAELGNDPTLGGLLPDTNQADWDALFDTAPATAAANLSIIGPNTPVSAKAGDQMETTVTVRNDGPGVAEDVTVTLYRSPDPEVTVFDSAVDSFTVRRLRSDSETSSRIRHNAPASEGNWYYAALADSSLRITESDENDNWGPRITVSVKPPFVDLSGSISASFDRPTKAGVKGNIEVTIRNRGNIDTSGSVGLDIYYTSDPNLPLAGAARMTSAIARVRLRTGDSRTYRLRTNLPDNISAGNYYLAAVIDSNSTANPDGLIAESDEDNNLALTDRPITVQPTVRDLTATLTTAFTNGAQPGDEGDFEVEITNRGTDPVDSTIAVSIAASADTHFDLPPTDPLVTSQYARLRLRPGQSRSYRFRRVVLPAEVAPATWYFAAKVDAEDDVLESNEDNNTALAGPISVSAPTTDLSPVAAQTDLPAVVTVGDRGTVEVSVANSGPEAIRERVLIDVVLSADTMYDAGDTSIVPRLRETNLSLRDDRPKNCRVRVEIPAGIDPGPYHLIACIDAGDTLPEADETNNRITIATIQLR